MTGQDEPAGRAVPYARATLAMIGNPGLGSCWRDRPDVACQELGDWRPFYQHYVCDACLRADAEDVAAGRGMPWRKP